ERIPRVGCGVARVVCGVARAPAVRWGADSTPSSNGNAAAQTTARAMHSWRRRRSALSGFPAGCTWTPVRAGVERADMGVTPHAACMGETGRLFGTHSVDARGLATNSPFGPGCAA